MKIELEYKLVVGNISYENIETGYWALNDTESNIKYRIKNMPDELQKENLKIAAIIEVLKNEISVIMSGKAANLLEYRII